MFIIGYTIHWFIIRTAFDNLWTFFFIDYTSFHVSCHSVTLRSISLRFMFLIDSFFYSFFFVLLYSPKLTSQFIRYTLFEVYLGFYGWSVFFFTFHSLAAYCSGLSSTRNSIYSIHSSYYSIDLADCIGTIILLLFSILSRIDSIFVRVFCWIVVLLIWLEALNWMNDLWIESFLGLTLTEQFSLIYGIKWLILSEWMLFFACFWSLMNCRVLSNAFSLFFSYPLFCSYSFAIPFSNLLILLFSSLPIQAAQIFLKIGFLINTIEGLGQSLCCGFLFIILQCKEFLYSYFSLSDCCMIGSIFYFTTGLHGFHVVFGSFGFFLIIAFLVSGSVSDYEYSIIVNLPWAFFESYRSFSEISFMPNTLIFFIEFSFSFFLCSYYWHFVDWIWFLVFLVFLFLFHWFFWALIDSFHFVSLRFTSLHSSNWSSFNFILYSLQLAALFNILMPEWMLDVD